MTSHLKIEQSEEIFQVLSENFIFKLDKSKFTSLQPSSSKNFYLISQIQTKIKNLTSEYIALHIKTNKKDNYKFHPSLFILEPHEIKSLTISYYSNHNDIKNNSGHKFLFQGIKIEENERKKNIKEIFEYYKNNHIKVKGNNIIRYVEFIYETKNDDFCNQDNIIYENLRNLTDDEMLENLKIEYYRLNHEINNMKIALNELKIREKLLLKKSSGKFEIKENNIIINVNKILIYFILSVLIGLFLAL